MSKKSVKFLKKRLARATSSNWCTPASLFSAALLTSTMFVAPAYAAQSGAIAGKVTDQATGQMLGGITVVAQGDTMPKPRTTITNADGTYSLPALLPGNYVVTFTSKDGKVRKINTTVLLQQTTDLNMSFNMGGADTEVITVTGSALVRQGNSQLTSSLNEDTLKALPVGQDYRDLLKLIPGVQYSPNSVLGPSAGGSGVDNKYGFDGVDVSLPMYGNLASEPSTHDIANVTMDRGGAKAVGFNRSGGFAINTTSKSGTNEFHGNVEYKLMNKNMVSDSKDAEVNNGSAKSTMDQNWLSASLGGPIIQDQLFFYASYYHPEEKKVNKATAYGNVKNYSSKRDEYFGKLTWAPTDNILINISDRTSKKTEVGASIGAKDADSVSQGAKADQDIITFDGSWLIDDNTTLTWQYGKFSLETASRPDNMVDVVPSVGGSLDINNLTAMGFFSVPELKTDADFDNVGAQALIDKYGYVGDDGQKTGGGGVGVASTINNQNFYRDSFQIALDHEFYSGDVSHKLHFGFQWKKGKEELSRLSNGWGSISYKGGQSVEDDWTGAPVYYIAYTQQMSFRDSSGNTIKSINSEMETYNFEFNDTIVDDDFTYNIGFLVSQDTLYGQGLKKKAGTVSGFETAPGHKYKMHTMDWKDMIQPRLSVTWNYSDQNKVFASYAAYNPEASSLARAASWDRNTQSTQQVYFDQSGNFLDSTPRKGSSGKLFQEGIKPRVVKEITIGTEQIINSHLLVRAHIRQRKADHFWEDTPNTARLSGTYGDSMVPADIAAKGLYIPNLDAIRSEIGGSSYVIAEMDGAFTKYYELNLEAEYKTDRTYLNVSYVWSHYYGNFDQDNTTATNDANTFVGSSYYGDGKGRYTWDNRYGNMSGDRPNIFKAYGYYTTNWNANIGAVLVAQSGQPWEKWDATVYGYSSGVSATSRYGEPAGSRRTPSHYQLDLNYTQNFVLTDALVLNFRADLFNVFNKQTGYNYDPYVTSSTFGEARNYFQPRRLQLSFNVAF